MYDERILREFPQEFQNKENIEILVRAFARQLDELNAVSAELKKLCDLDAVQGKQLDGIGDIAVLSRSDAMRLIKGPITYDIMDDEHYRHYLRYKILKNTSTCNYYDIITAVQMLWGADDIEYFEDPAEPATVTLTFPDPGGAVQLDDIPPIIAAGVGIHIRAKSLIHVTQKIFAGSCVGVHETQVVRPHRYARRIRQKLFSGTASVVHEKTGLQPYDRPRRREAQTGLFAGSRMAVTEIMRVNLIDSPKSVNQSPPFFIGRYLTAHEILEVRPHERPRSRTAKNALYAGSRMGVLELLRIDIRNTSKTVNRAPPFFIGRHLVLHETVTIRPWKKEMMTVDNRN